MKSRSNIKNILITGGSGFIGSNFLTYALSSKSRKDKNFYSKKIRARLVAPTHKKLDIYNGKQVKKIFAYFHPEIVINFAAYRNANLAELQRGDKTASAWKTNVLGVKNLLKTCQKFESFFIHISTDMVFSGSQDNPGPYHEGSQIENNEKKLSWYGWTKAEAERMLARKKNTAIIRIGNVTQPIYDPQLDYVGKILYLFDQKKLYPLFHDQYLTLTYVCSLFEGIESLIQNKTSGIFHVASKNLFTPYELAKYLIKKTRGREHLVKHVSIEKYLKNSPNRYPKFGGLQVKQTQKRLQIPLYNWEEIVDIYIKKLES